MVDWISTFTAYEGYGIYVIIIGLCVFFKGLIGWLEMEGLNEINLILGFSYGVLFSLAFKLVFTFHLILALLIKMN